MAVSSENFWRLQLPVMYLKSEVYRGKRKGESTVLPQSPPVGFLSPDYSPLHIFLHSPQLLSIPRCKSPFLRFTKFFRSGVTHGLLFVKHCNQVLCYSHRNCHTIYLPLKDCTVLPNPYCQNSRGAPCLPHQTISLCKS